MHKALILEDHEGTREWWREALPATFPGTSTLEAATMAEGIQLLAQHTIWLAIIDIQLPDGDGIEFLARTRDSQPGAWRVICTVYQDDAHVFAALRAGAQGYLVKDDPHPLQLSRLREILDGQPPLSPGIAQRILGFFEEPASSHPSQELTGRELDVLRLMAKGYSRPEVAELLGLSVNTIASHCKQIYRKLQISSRAEAVVEAIRLGLINP